MAQLSFGIDISDSLLSGVGVVRDGKDARITACAFRRLRDDSELDEALPLLLKELEWKDGSACDVGISLSCLSLRNLSLPFTDKKKIDQILPFELEEQLLTSVDQQIIATAPVAGQDRQANRTKLLAAAVEKSTVARYVALFNSRNAEPDRICPAGFVLTDRFCRTDRKTEDFLVLSCDLCSITMIAVHQGTVVFMRRLAYPTEVFTHALFSFDGSRVRTDDPDAAEQAVTEVCRAVEHSMDIFSLHSALTLQPDCAVLSGPMQLGEGFQEKIEAELGLVCRACDLVRDGAAALSPAMTKQWLPAVFDRPLALALQAGDRKKTVPLNFRKGEFAPPHHLLRSKKQIVRAALAAGCLFIAITGYLFFDYRQLQKKYDTLAADQEQVFRKTFSGIEPGRDPLMHMRSKLKEMDTGSVSMPVFSQEKRILVVLADISSRIPSSLDLHVIRLIIDQESVKLNGTTDAFNNVNTIKSLLTESDRYSEVNIVSATKGKEKEGIRFEIRLQLAGGTS
ncbi:MAG: type II secretion system protein GspL [Candidatus Electrothrix sp. YB6]